MKTALIFAGTTEGRELAERLARAEIPVEVCVATEYGEQVLQGQEGIKIHQGRLSAKEMQALYARGEYFVVVDCTHPFASLVTENIRESVKGSEMSYLRVSREWEPSVEAADIDRVREQQTGEIRWFSDARACADALAKQEREFHRILLTTGSKELPLFCQTEEVKEKLIVRVLPGRESMEACWREGLSGKQIIAMQGASTKEMNLAVIRQYGIDCLVTKESGKNGGEGAKVEAAAEAGIPCFMICRPKYEGIEELTVDEAFEKVCMLFTKTSDSKQESAKEPLQREARMHVVLAGMGMGSVDSMTVALQKQLERTDYLFGAPRLLEGIIVRGEKYPFYLAKDILPKLQELQAKQGASERDCHVTVLFSGDSGFFSGCGRVREALENLDGVSVMVLPGISSLSDFCAKIGEEWQDAEILSAHGVAEAKWSVRMLGALRKRRKVFLLTSGPEDIQRIGGLLTAYAQEIEKIRVGYQLSYPEEKIESLNPQECQQVTEKGLYVLMIVPKGEHAESVEQQGKSLAPCLRDDAFLRGKVPMTKEEVRELSVCKLGLWEGAVAYDVGSGTGSVAVQMAALSGSVSVFAIEQGEEALELIRQNKERFGLENIRIVSGMAPESMKELPAPTHAFIGGSKGRLREILDCLYQKNSRMRIVINAGSMEGIAGAQEAIQEFPVEELDIISVQISKAKQVGAYHLMMAQNPVTIFSFRFCESDGVKADVTE